MGMILALAVAAAQTGSAAAGVSADPAPIGSPGRWLSADDYPPAAIRQREEGRVIATVAVDATGHPTGCTITESSASSSLDAATCTAAMTHGAFRPARDARHHAIAGLYAFRVRWTLPTNSNAGPPDEPLVPATPEAMGLSQADFERLHLPPGTMVGSAGPSITQGRVHYLQPGASRSTATAGWQPLQVGTVLAREEVRIEEQAWRLDRPLMLPAPFSATVAADSIVGGTIDPVEGDRPCLLRWPHRSYEPYKDEHGEIYSSLCLLDRDGDGAYDHVRLTPYRSGPPVRDVPIAPAHLIPLPSGQRSDLLGHAATMIRELLVTALTTDEASIVLRDRAAFDGWPGADQPLDVATATMPLRNGATTSFGGVTSNLRRRGDRWQVETTGRFTPWFTADLPAGRLVLGDRTFAVPDR